MDSGRNHGTTRAPGAGEIAGPRGTGDAVGASMRLALSVVEHGIGAGKVQGASHP